MSTSQPKMTVRRPWTSRRSISTHLPADRVQNVDREAAARGVTRSTLIATLIVDQLDNLPVIAARARPRTRYQPPSGNPRHTVSAQLTAHDHNRVITAARHSGVSIGSLIETIIDDAL